VIPNSHACRKPSSKLSVRSIRRRSSPWHAVAQLQLRRLHRGFAHVHACVPVVLQVRSSAGVQYCRRAARGCGTAVPQLDRQPMRQPGSVAGESRLVQPSANTRLARRRPASRARSDRLVVAAQAESELVAGQDARGVRVWRGGRRMRPFARVSERGLPTELKRDALQPVPSCPGSHRHNIR
jgi:hypothetical protein